MQDQVPHHVELRQLSRRLHAAHRNGGVLGFQAGRYARKVDSFRTKNAHLREYAVTTYFGPNMYGPAVKDVLRSALYWRDTVREPA